MDINETVSQLYSLGRLLDAVGFIPVIEQFPYFCTPENVLIFADMGMDGIHFCVDLSPEGKKRILMVDPSPGEGRVCKVAENLEDFLSLLLKVPDIGVIYTASFGRLGWYEEEIERLSARCDENPEKKVNLPQLRQQLRDLFSLRDIPDPFAYVTACVSQYSYVAEVDGSGQLGGEEEGFCAQFSILL